MDSTGAKFFSSGLESFFNQEAHSLQRCSGLIYKINDAFGGIAVGQEVVDEKHFVFLSQIVAAYAYGI